MADPSLSFEDWKQHLRQDCELKQKLTAFNALSENVLRLFWDQGVDPTIEGLVGSTKQVFYRS
jgi:hypothetical protein